MPRQYDAFFVRHWHLEGDDRRIEIVHVQTGQRTLFTTLPQAVAWLDTHTALSPGGPDATAERPTRDRQAGEAVG